MNYYFHSHLKKVCLILLIALLQFNLFGYRLLFSYMQWQSDIKTEAALDKADYNEADLITITVPLSVPYQINQSNFERIDGEIRFNGKVLKYVKRKVSNGNLVLLCIPDQNKMKLQSVKDDFFKSSNDLVQNDQSKKSEHTKAFSFKNILGDYISNMYDFPAFLHIQSAPFAALYLQVYLLSSLHNSPEQPPDFT